MMTASTQFHEIFDSHHDRLRRFIVVTLKDEWGADDILQETFLRAQTKIDTLKDKQKIGAWLCRIAYNLCLDHLRKKKRQSAEPLIDEVMGEPSELESTETALTRHQMSVCIQNQVLYLPEQYRTAVWLFDVLGFSLKEISEVLEISVENVKVRLHRARKKLKAILEKNCSFEKDHRDVLICEPREGVDWRGNLGHSGQDGRNPMTEILSGMPSKDSE